MNQKLYLFNPENDLAVASGAPHYMAPPRARAIAGDLALLPLWYAENDSWVLCDPDRATEWMQRERRLLGITTTTIAREDVQSRVEDGTIREFIPWGWSPATVFQFKKLGIPIDLLPNATAIEQIRRLSHRALTIDLLRTLATQPEIEIPGAFPVELFAAEEVTRFVCSAPRTVLKAPWSGSGKGIVWGYGQPEIPITNWSNGILRRQGSVIGEPYYQKEADLAMEFYSDGKERVSFAGYSRFFTDEKGVYKKNRLASDEAIFADLSHFVAGTQLESVKSALETILSARISSVYSGYLGIDMLICREEGLTNCLHPCVELNLRMNMGMVSRLFYDRYVASGRMGSYYIDFNPEPGAILRDHQERLSALPLIISSGKIQAGYLSLCPIDEHSCYRARVEIL